MNAKRELVLEKEWVGLGVVVSIGVIIVAGIFSGGKSGNFYRSLDSIVIGGFTYLDIGQFILLGFTSGLVGGMLGMGGGLLKVSNLHFLCGFDLIFARTASLLSYVVISVSAFLRYRKYNFILWNVVRLLVPSSILGAVLGVIIGTYIDERIIEIVLGLYALFVGVTVLNQIWTKPDEKEVSSIPDSAVNESVASAIGIGMGFISTLIGISGGVVAIPLQQMVLKIPFKNAIADSVTTAIFCSITASVMFTWIGVYNGSFSFSNVIFVTLCLLPGNVVGAQYGGYLTKRLSINIVRVIFAIVVFIIGFKILG